jgi:hypothetical protein
MCIFSNLHLAGVWSSPTGQNTKYTMGLNDRVANRITYFQQVILPDNLQILPDNSQKLSDFEELAYI